MNLRRLAIPLILPVTSEPHGHCQRKRDHFSRPGAARLLVIVSDGHFRDIPRREAQNRITRLRAAGCAVLWLAPADTTTNPLDGTTVHPLTDPTITAQAIGRAATTALRTST